MKKNKIFLILCFLFFIIDCSRGIKRIDIVDDTFQFNKIGFSKTYEVSTYLHSFDIGIYFFEATPKSNIELGMLEVKIIFDNDRTTVIYMDGSELRFFYSDIANQLVNKVNYPTVDFENTFFVKEIVISVNKTFNITSDSQLLITNLGSELFFIRQE